MASIARPKADLAELAEVLRAVSKALRSLPADRAEFHRELEALREKVQTVAVALKSRGDEPKPTRTDLKRDCWRRCSGCSSAFGVRGMSRSR